MFEELFTHPSVLARHRAAPYAEERERCLAHCRERGETRATLLFKARTLVWVARQLRVYPTLAFTIDEIGAVACGGTDTRWTRRRFVDVARPWLRLLRCLREPEAQLPFHTQLAEYDDWAAHERGFTPATVERTHGSIAQFLRWYDTLARPLGAVQATDVDAYLAQGRAHGWGRHAVRNEARALRSFGRYGATRGWRGPHLAEAIHGPRLYALEGLPAGPAWADVQHLLADVDTPRPKDVRDRAMLMLLAGLPSSTPANARRSPTFASTTCDTPAPRGSSCAAGASRRCRRSSATASSASPSATRT